MFNDTRGELLIEMIPFFRLLTSRRKAGDGRSVEASVGLTTHHGNSMKVDHGINALNIPKHRSIPPSSGASLYYPPAILLIVMLL
jgi:hypothetical protein